MLNYGISWGDCPSGCIWNYGWDFTIYEDCSLQSDRAGGNINLRPIASVENLINYNANPIFYPNPSTGIITIETEPQSTIVILDLQGKILQSKLSQEGKTEMDVSALGNGTYFVRITSKDGKTQVGKFIKE